MQSTFVTGRPESTLEFHLIDSFIDEVEMVRWTLGGTNKNLSNKKKPLFKKKLWVQRGTEMKRIKYNYMSRALGYWVTISGQN